MEVIFPEGSQLELDAGCQVAILASIASWIALSGVFRATDMNGITRQQFVSRLPAWLNVQPAHCDSNETGHAAEDGL